MNFWLILAGAVFILLLSIIIFATKFFFPYHRVVALVVLSIGFIFFIWATSLKRPWIYHDHSSLTNFLLPISAHITIGIALLVGLYVIITLFPVARSPFKGLSDSEISTHLYEDKTVLRYLDQQHKSLVDQAREQNLFSLDFNTISPEEKESLEEFWSSYLDLLLELDLLKSRYQTFYQLKPITQRDLHKGAFNNGYTAFVFQHYYVLGLIREIKNPDIITYLNQPFNERGIDSNQFRLLKEKITNPDELLRLSTGRAYYYVLNGAQNDETDPVRMYLGSLSTSINQHASLVNKRPLDFLEKNSSKVWFPIQKNIALDISYIRLSRRDYHIRPEQIQEHKNSFLPGDIFLERREWHATNIGIPGFWTHSALYTGEISFLDSYFSGIPELEGVSFSQFVESKFPEVHKEMLLVDDSGYPYAVIESKRPGVILESLEASTNADSVAVLRVKDLTVSDRFEIVVEAMSHVGKPYDYDFDFATDTALVCSELVYKAHVKTNKFTAELQKFNGRLLMSPNEFAEKFVSEIDSTLSQMELILFLDSDETKGVSIEKTIEDFITSPTRPKWNAARQLIDG